MTVTVKVIKDSYVRPTTASSSPSVSPSPRVELAGVDVLFQRMNLRVVYFFPSYLSAHALKSSLARVLDKFPILAGRQRKEGRKTHYIELNGKGVLVRQQLATVAGGEKGKGALLDDHFLKTHVHSFIHGKKNMGVNDERESNLIVTLTEVDYEEEERGGTGGGGGLLNGLFGGCMATSCYPEAPNEEWHDVSFEAAGEGGGEGGWGKPIRYAVGVCISHDIADGGSVAAFLLAWAMASMGKPFPKAVMDRGPLRQIPPAIASARLSSLPLPPGLCSMGTVSTALFMGRFLLMAMSSKYDFVKLKFTGKELENLKAAAMLPLVKAKAGDDIWVSTSNALAAHLWPILSPLIATPGGEGREGGREGGRGADADLISLAVIVNYRKALEGIGPMYYGNCVGLKRIQVDAPLLPEQPERSVQLEKALPSLTRLALKIRKGVVVNEEAKQGYLDEAHYLQKALADGKIGNMQFGLMVDAAKGKPLLLWDDVSGFQPGGMGFGLCGVTATRADFYFDPFPGIALVMPTAPGPDGLAGKEVCVCMHKASAARVCSDKLQARIHKYAPKEGTTTGGAGKAVKKGEGGEEVKDASC